MANQWVLPGVVLAVIGIVVGAMVINQETADNCGGGTGHWHAAYSVWVDGERIPFNNPAFEQHSTEDNNKNTHIHGNDGIYHFHPNPSDLCVSWHEAFDHLDMDVNEDGITLGSLHGEREGTHEGTVQVYQQKWSNRDAEFKPVDFGVLGASSPDNADAFVILVGDYTQEEIDSILSRAPQIRGSQSYDPHYGS